MKNVFLLVAALVVGNVTAQTKDADAIKGFWFTQDKDSKVKIFLATNGKYYGKIVWLKEPNESDGTPKIDDENPDDKLKSRPILNLMLLNGFKYNTKEQKWDQGTIYDPTNGSTYKCYMWFEDGNQKILHVKGFIGFSMIGREVEWTRTVE